MKLRWAALAVCALPFASALLQPTDRGAHVPFQVALVKTTGLGTGDTRFVDAYKCSGVLFELDYVWTTKTCLDQFNNKNDITVIAGTSDLTASQVTPATNQRAVSQWWKHPNSQVNSWANYDNVAALKLASAFATDSGKIEKATFVVDSNALSGLKGTDVEITGWGSVTKANPKPTAKLQELSTKYKLETLPNSEYPKNTLSGPSNEMALALEKANLEQGVCDFDEGSPIFHGTNVLGISAPGCAIPKLANSKKFDVALGHPHYKGWLDLVKANTATTDTGAPAFLPASTPCTDKKKDTNVCQVKEGFGSQHFPTLGPICIQGDPASTTSTNTCPRSKCTPLAITGPPSAVAGSTTSFEVVRGSSSCVDTNSDPVHRQAMLLSTDGNTKIADCTVADNGLKFNCAKTTASTASVIAVLRETSATKVAHAQTGEIKFTEAAPTVLSGNTADYVKINGTDKAAFATPVQISWDNQQLSDKNPKSVEFFAVDPLESNSFSDAEALNAEDRWVRLTDKIDATASATTTLKLPIPYEQIKDMMESRTGTTEDVKHFKIITRTTGGGAGLATNFVTDLKIDDRPGGLLALTDAKQRDMVRDVLWSGNPVQAANLTTKLLDDGDSEDEIREQIGTSLAEHAKSKSLFGFKDTQGTKAESTAEGFRLLSENAVKHDGKTENMFNIFSTYVDNMADNVDSKPSVSNIRKMMGVTQALKSFKTSGHKLAVLAQLAGREQKEFKQLEQMTKLLRQDVVSRYTNGDIKVNEVSFACSDGSTTPRNECKLSHTQTFISAVVADAAGLATEVEGVNYSGASPAIPLTGTPGVVARTTIEYFTSSGPNPFDKATVEKDKGLKEWRGSSIRPSLWRVDTGAIINQDFSTTNGPTVNSKIITGTEGGLNLVADRDYCTTRSVVSTTTTLSWKKNPVKSGESFVCPLERVSNLFYSVGYQFKAGEEAIFSAIETDESSDDDGSSSGGSLWFLWAALFILCICCIIAAVLMMMKKKGKSTTTTNNHTAAAPQTSYGMAPNTTPTDAVPVGNHMPAQPQTHVGDVYGQAANYGNPPSQHFFDQDGNPVNK